MLTLEDISAKKGRLQVLAELRHELRLFLVFSEDAALGHGLQPQQHQLLLQIAGAPEGVATTIGYAAERLGVRHNTAVELCDRCEQAGLLTRSPSDIDRRSMLLTVTVKGHRILDSLSGDHGRELNERAPRLIRALKRLRMVSSGLNDAEEGATNEL